jgi:hypothetical protein
MFKNKKEQKHEQIDVIGNIENPGNRLGNMDLRWDNGFGGPSIPTSPYK